MKTVCAACTNVRVIPPSFWRTLSALGVAAVIAGLGASPNAQRPNPGFITGVVQSSNGFEAGVWVIAETTELPTKFAKIVVTNDQGRFLLPDLPDVSYRVWVRGYGLADSVPVIAKPGEAALSLKAVVAKNTQEAAKVYPANYWYALAEAPSATEFPGTGPQGNGIATTLGNQSQWIGQMKTGCETCHQLGIEHTRSLKHLQSLGLKSSVEMWDHRVQVGQTGASMTTMMNSFGRERGLKMYADWTDRIAAGEVPQTAPPRPKGIERNLVLTVRDWGNEGSYMHDEIATARANPRVNAYGPVYGVSAGHGKLVGLDPNMNRAFEISIPTRQDAREIPSRYEQVMLKPSPLMGSAPIWKSPEGAADPHNPMFDKEGRIWTTSVIRDRPNPLWCKDGKLNKFAAWWPLDVSGRQASFYDAKTKKWTLIDTCYTTHHLVFGEDADEMLYFSTAFGRPALNTEVIPWVNTKTFHETQNEQAAQGWCPIVADTNGDGKITKPWNEIQGGIDPKLDTRFGLAPYSVVVDPTDQSVWGAVVSFPGQILRFTPGANPPESCISEVYTVPGDGERGFGPRGIDIDRNGIVWVALSGSGGFASFDRRKCTVFSGPETASGQQCSQGWTYYPLTVGPKLKGTEVNADFHYYNWVDQFNTSGLGANLPIATGSGSDSLLVLKPETKEWITLRVPYPLGFFSRGLDGRIDDPNAGWKGRGLWAQYGNNAIWHTEGGRGTTGKLVHFQIRPDPLAQ